MTTGGQYAFVQGRLGPAGRRLEVQELVAFTTGEVKDFVHGVHTGLDLILLRGEAEGQARGLADRVTHVDTGTQAVDRITCNVNIEVFVVGGAVEGVVAQAHTVCSPVGVGVAEVVSALVFAAGQADGHTVTGTQEVVLRDGTTQDQTGALSETDAGGDRTRGLFFHGVVHVNLVIHTRYSRGFDVDFLEEAQAFKTGLGLVDQVGRSPATFHLTHFTTQHFVRRLGVATEVDAVYVGTFARIDNEGDVHGVVFIIRGRYAVDVGEGIAFVTQAAGDQF